MEHETIGDVTLHGVEDGDLDVFFAQQQEPEARHLAAFVNDHPEDRAAFDRHWRRLRHDGAVNVLTIRVAGNVAGHVGAFDSEGRREVTYWLGRAWWGRGVATAALSRLLALETRRPLHARVAQDNVASRRVLEKCGFVVYGQERAFASGRGEEIAELLLRLG